MEHGFSPSLSIALLSASRWATYLCSFLLVGAAGFRWLVLRALGDTVVSSQPVPALAKRASRIGIAASSVLLAVGIVRLYAQTYSIFGLDEPVTFDLMLVVATETRWGRGWLVQVASAVVAIAAFAWAGRGSGLAWGSAAGVSLATAASLALTGHAVASPQPLLTTTLQIVHLLGGGVWIGTLALVLTVGVWGLRRELSGEKAVAAMVNAFSPVALAGAGALVAAGVVTAVVYLDSVADLWRTAYGLTLLGKTSLFLGVVALGAYNWRRVKPRLGAAGGGRRLSRSGSLELAITILVLAVTAVLVGLPLPGE